MNTELFCAPLSRFRRGGKGRSSAGHFAFACEWRSPASGLRLLRAVRWGVALAVGLGTTATSAWAVPVASEAALRAAIADPAVVTIELEATVALTSELVIARKLKIAGPGDAPDTRQPRFGLLGGATHRIARITTTAQGVEIEGVAFLGGNAAGGGAVLVESGATATFRGCDFSGNQATGSNLGGAILNRGTLTLDQCLIALNSANHGGGIASLGRLQVVRSLIEGNTASNSGGGIYSSAADLWLESSTISGNAAGTGGAIAFLSSNRVVRTATINAVTVVDNSARSQSGGLYVEGSGAVANVGGSILARNVLINSSGSRTQHDCGTQQSGKITSTNYNILLKPGTTLSPNGPNDQLNVDPLVGALAYNGGRTRTHAIGVGSPARDRGAPTFAGSLVTTDQRGEPRVWPLPPGGRVDIGAYEFTASLDVSCQPNPLEYTATRTPATLTARLLLPRGGPITATWTVGGVIGSPVAATVPDNGQPYDLTYNADFPYGPTVVTVRVKSGTLELPSSTTVQVVDTTPPVIRLKGESPAYVEYPTGTFVDPGATAVDTRDGEFPATAHTAAVIPTPTLTGLPAYLSATYSATDTAGNQATQKSRVVIFQDTQPPVIPPLPDMVAEATGAAGAAVSFSASASDLASGAVPVTFVPASGSTFALGATTVTATAKDATGNTATATFKVTVQDKTPPALIVPADQVIEATGASGAAVTLSASASDLVSGAVPVSFSPASGSTFALGTTTVTATATDGAGNSATKTFKVTVRDTTPPVLTLPANLAVLAKVAGGAVVTFAPTATDTVSVPVVTTAPASGSVFPVGTTTVSVAARDAAGNVASGTFSVVVTDPYGVTVNNVVWPLATDLAPKFTVSGGKLVGTVRQMIARAGEARWYKFKGAPGSRIEVTLTNQPGNFDLVVYGDIRASYTQLLGLIAPSSSAADKKLALLGVEFAPEAYSPEAYSPEAYSPEAYSPEAYSPEAYSPEAYSPEAYSPEAYSPEAYSPEAYSPEAYSPEAYSPEAYSPEAYSPEAYASAQQRSMIAFSAAPGTSGEGVRFSTYTRSGEFYLRVRGQNGVFSTDAPYTLTVAIQQNLGAGVTDLNTTPATSPVVTGAPTSLIVWDSARIGGPATEVSSLTAALARFALAAKGVVVDVAGDAQIARLNVQADANADLPLAKNLVADAIRNLIQAYRRAAPSIADITLLGNDAVIPFFRSDDKAQLASEANYFPPVKDGTASQSSLRYAQVLSQDRYGSSSQVFLGTGPYDLPELPVGRLVETAAEVRAYLDAYAPLFNATATSGVVPTPRSALVAGYDFLADSAEAIRTEFAAGLGGAGTVGALISPIDQAPQFGWTADQLRTAFLGTRRDLSYLAGHFSTGGTLAADFKTRFLAREVADSTVNLTYALVMSAGCHSGYSTVDKDAIPLLTDQPDWSQAFARKRAIWIAGTGYQYGDTDFIEYTERLLLQVSRALRTGAGPVAVGRALVEAKRRYLADTAIIRGIHEKTLLQVSLYGLPMVKFDLPGARLAPPATGSDVAVVAPVAAGPGTAHALGRGDLSFSPSLTRVDRTLDVVGSTATIAASYFRGSDGIVSILGEPVRPLESFNLNRPEGLVRGVGFRGARYRDLAGFVPFTGAPATETRGVHGRFSTEVFYPSRPWNLNQLGELSAAGGGSTLNVFPTQFVSDGPAAAAGTLRSYDQMQFTVFYSSPNSPAALANPPAINVVSSAIGATAVSFAIDVAATAGAGVQEVWVTYTGTPGSSWHGVWQSLTLTAPATATGIGTWTGSLPLAAGTAAGQIRYVVQAVNGVGGVVLNSNFGRYFTPGASTLDGVGVVSAPTTLTFLPPVPTGGTYRSSVALQARLTDGSGQTLAGKPVQFRIGSASKSVVTDGAGIAAATLLLNSRPDAYTLEASFAGDATHQNSAVTQPFAIAKIPTRLTFDAATAAAPVVVRLRADDGTPLKERTVLFVLDNGATRTAFAEITDAAGLARLTSSTIPPGAYQVSAYFGRPVTLPDGTIAPLNDPLYDGSTASQSVTLGAVLAFSREQAWVNYADSSATGATAGNQGLSWAILSGSMDSSVANFGPTSILAASSAPTVTAYVRATLAGKTIAAGTVTLRVLPFSRRHWWGDAVIGGTAVTLHVDWCEDRDDDERHGSDAAGQFQIWINPPSGFGPLYNATPAQLNFELILGTGAGERPARGVTTIGGPEKPWTQQISGSRVRSN